jgi:NADH-quinone oxidoreductase subunit G
VISQGHYQGKIGMHKPTETFSAVHGGRAPKLLMDIHSVSEVNQPSIDLSLIEGPAHSTDFNSKKD